MLVNPPSKDCCYCPTPAVLIRIDVVDGSRSASDRNSELVRRESQRTSSISPGFGFQPRQMAILKVAVNETEAGSGRCALAAPPPRLLSHTPRRGAGPDASISRDRRRFDDGRPSGTRRRSSISKRLASVGILTDEQSACLTAPVPPPAMTALSAPETSRQFSRQLSRPLFPNIRSRSAAAASPAAAAC